MSNYKYGFSTKAVHVGEEPDFREGATGDVVVPIHLSTTFARKKVLLPPAGYVYTPSSNPTRETLKSKLPSLEHASFCFAFSSGFSAVTTLLFSLL